MTRVLCLGLICISLYASQIETASTLTTTQTNHVTKPSSNNVGETLHFTYQPETHHMILTRGHVCYIGRLTNDDRRLIHTDGGVLAIELRILRSLNTSVPIDIADVDHRDRKLCREGHDQYCLLHV